MTQKYKPGDIIGYRKNGLPIRLIAGGSEPAIEIPITPEPTPNSGPTFTADDLAKARQEEKDKLYSRLSKTEEQLTSVSEQLKQVLNERQAERDAEAARIREAEAAAEEARKKAAEEEMTFKDLLAQRDAEWQERFTKYEQDREQERALLEKERLLAEHMSYIQRRANEERENIAPELIDFISGDTPEQVEASIELLKEKTASIASNIASATTAPAMRGVSPVGYGADGPLNNHSATKTYTAEELRNMPISEYAKHVRPHVLGSSSHGKGLFN